MPKGKRRKVCLKTNKKPNFPRQYKNRKTIQKTTNY